MEHYKTIHENELKDLKAIRAQMKTDNRDSPHLSYWLMAVRFGALINEAHLKWSIETLAQMADMVEANEGKDGR